MIVCMAMTMCVRSGISILKSVVVLEHFTEHGISNDRFYEFCVSSRNVSRS